MSMQASRLKHCFHQLAARYRNSSDRKQPLGMRSRRLAVGLTTILSLLLPAVWVNAQEAEPIKVLLITGGCCHDYTTQKNLIKQGLEERANIVVTVVQQGGTSTNAKIELYKNADWADGYDLVIHDECFADVNEPEWTQRVLKPHQEGVPAVVIHCAMHCYRDGTDEWFKFCGVTSRRHGAHYPHEVLNRDAEHPIMEGWGAGWANPAGELYWIEKVWPTAHPLASAKNREKGNEEVCVWTNDYHGTKVFGTTLGHHNETVSDPKFLDLLTRGCLWACDRLNDDDLKPIEAKRVPVNLAKGGKAKASSEQTGNQHFAKDAVDGSSSTRWCAENASAPQWLEIELSEEQQLRGCRLNWEFSQVAYRYRVETSSDGQEWKTVIDKEDNKQPTSDHQFDPVSAKWIRIHFLGSENGSWGSLWEVEVYGDETELVDPKASILKREQEVLADVEVPEGFKATLFAAPPAVLYPVFVAADTNGTLYVSVDKNGSLDRETKRGAIYRLRDLDNDGRADETKLFVDDVDSPRGLVWDRDRLYVLHPPHLSAFIDTDLDGIADEQQVLVKDLAFTFADRPADHTSNGVTLGADGWLYLAIGDFGFMKATGSDGKELGFRGGGVVRVRPDGSDIEIYSRGTRNILEVGLDPRLNGFTRDNTNDGGGWDIRMHHFTGLDHHGYPTLFKNFPDEIIQPLADYGGGSGCGACYIAEPGLPPGFGDAMYTADWGRSWVYRHQMTPHGATFKADETPFIKVPRVTDLDVDANSRIYVSSWKGATFKYVGEDVGYVVQLTSKDANEAQTFDWFSMPQKELLKTLEGPSHRQRLAAQRELLQRGWDIEIPRQLNQLAANPDARLESRIAAIFTLSLGLGPQAIEPLRNLADDPALRPFIIRAISEMPSAADQPAPIRLLQQSLADKNPRTRLEAIRAIERLKVDVLADPLLACIQDADPIVSHTAINAVAELGLWEAGFEAWDKELDAGRQGRIMLALQRIHDPQWVDRLLGRIDTLIPEQRQQIFTALCRLYFVEGNWKGDSWGTRPDTRGPYYQPEAWDATERISEALQGLLFHLGPDETIQAVAALNRHRINDSGFSFVLQHKAQHNVLYRPALLDWIGTDKKVDDGTIQVLRRVVSDPATKPQALAQSLQAWWRAQSVDVEPIMAGLSRLEQSDETRYRQTWDAIRQAKSVAKHRDRLIEVASEDQPSRDRALACLLSLVSRPGGRQTTPPEVDRVLQQAWETTAGQQRWLSAIELTGDRYWETRIWQLSSSEDAEVSQRALELAKRWNLTPLTPTPGPTIKELGVAKAMEDLGEPAGHEERGQQWFARLNCANCHTVAPHESPRGPYLPNVAKTYDRKQLAEAILDPSKTLAQGFVTELFTLVDGSTLTGFVTEEAATRIVIRDSEGRETILSPEDIEDRAKQTISVMPEGLADELGPQDLRDLLDYVQSLGKLATSEP